MAKHKLRRFAENETFPNLVQGGRAFPPHNHAIKGKWNREFFRNDNGIELELGCGRGEYTVYLAEHFPDHNFIGVDIKGARLWRGAKTALEKGFKNAAFLRIQIEHLEYYFDKNEVSGIWITFPDPQPQQTRENKRLTSPRFLESYMKILRPGGLVRLKTDSSFLFGYTLGVIESEGYKLVHSVEDIYSKPDLPEELTVKTTYEKIFEGKGSAINYLEFTG